MLITFIRTAIITLDIDDHHIAVLGKPFVTFPYRRFVMALPIGRDNNAIIRLLYNIQVRHGIWFNKRKFAPLLLFSSESSDGLCGKFVKLAVSSHVKVNKSIFTVQQFDYLVKFFFDLSVLVHHSVTYK